MPPSDEECAVRAPVVERSPMCALPNLLSWTWFLVTVITLNLPSFYASNNPTLALHYAKSQWEAIRVFLAVLIPIILSNKYMSNDSTSTLLWFCLTSSLLHAFMGLTSSTVLIIFFCGLNEENENFKDINNLSYRFWTIWDLVAAPSIWTSWSIVTFIINFLITAGCSSSRQGNSSNDGGYDHPVAARAIMVLVTILSISSFMLFLLYVRHLGHILTRKQRQQGPQVPPRA